MDTNILMQSESVIGGGDTEICELNIQIDGDGSISDTSVTQLTSSDCNSFVNAQTKRCNTLTSITSSDTSQSSETESDTQIAQNKIQVSSSASVNSSVDSSSEQSEKNGNNGINVDNSGNEHSALDSDCWYLHPRFNFYWQHYNHTMSWCRKHYSVVRYLRQKYASRHRNQTFPYTYPVPVYSRNSSTQHYPNMNGVSGYRQYSEDANFQTSDTFGSAGRGRGRGRVNKTMTNGLNSSNGETEDSLSSMNESTEDTGTSYSDSEEFEMEITDEMLEFFAHSKKHREERDEKKLDANGMEEEKHVDADSVKVNKKVPTREAPKERPGSRRTAEMVTLYGKGAAMIHGMETALQMTFDRNMDIKQPKVWPNMPINTKIMFYS